MSKVLLTCLACALMCVLLVKGPPLLRKLKARSNKVPPGLKDYQETKESFRELASDLKELRSEHIGIHGRQELLKALQRINKDVAYGQNELDPFCLSNRIGNYSWNHNEVFVSDAEPLVWKGVHIYFPEVVVVTIGGEVKLMDEKTFRNITNELSLKGGAPFK